MDTIPSAASPTPSTTPHESAGRKTYTIIGVDRLTGDGRTLTIEATDRASAERAAHKAGIKTLEYQAQRVENSVGADTRRAAAACSRVSFLLAITVVGLPLSLVFWLASIHLNAQAEQIQLLAQIAKKTE